MSDLEKFALLYKCATLCWLHFFRLAHATCRVFSCHMYSVECLQLLSTPTNHPKASHGPVVACKALICVPTSPVPADRSHTAAPCTREGCCSSILDTTILESHTACMGGPQCTVLSTLNSGHTMRSKGGGCRLVHDMHGRGAPSCEGEGGGIKPPLR
jgi:hypothetical protein